MAIASLVACPAVAVAAAAAATEVAADEAAPAEDIVVTGRQANASINGIAVAPIRLPQSVRLLDRQLISDIGATRIDDLLDLAGSVSRQNAFGGLWDNYAIRGFSGDVNGGPDLLINRFNANRGYNAARDVATIEVFQVLKGPAAALSGKGEPGGSINIVTKTPLDRVHASAAFEAGNYDHYRETADVGGPITDTLAVRLIGVREDNGSFRDTIHNGRTLIAPSVAFAPTPDIHLLYQLEYSLFRSPFDRGVVAVANDGKALPRSRFLGEPTDGDVRLRSTQHQGSFTAAVAGGVTIEGGVEYRDGTVRGFSTEASTLIGTSLRRQRRYRDYDFDDLIGRLEIAAAGRFAGIDHQFRIGVDGYRYQIGSLLLRINPTAAAPYAIAILAPVYGQPQPIPLPNTNTNERQRGKAAYAQDLVSIGDHLSLLLGIRRDAITQRVINNRTGLVTRQAPKVTSPRAALTLKPSDSLSFYVSWGRSFRFNQGTDVAGAAFAPERGRAYEGGVKYALHGGGITGTVSLFDIRKSNVLTADGTTGFSRATGSASSRGAEADINVRLDRRLTLTAVYAYVDARVLRDTIIPRGTPLADVPKHSASLFAQWRTDGSEAGSIAIGGGATYVGSREGSVSGGPYRLPRYVTARADIGYNLTRHVSAHIDANNLFDAHYLASSYNELWTAPGTPRTVRARIQADF